MTQVKTDPGNPAFTSVIEDDPMGKHESDVADLDPSRVFESVVSELENLLSAVPVGEESHLFELYGALLAYNLEGRVELLPEAFFGASPRRWKERRVLRAARSIGRRGQGDPDLIVRIAAQVIETNLYRIDPELQWFAS
jgi:hypothetical protein